ncbi:class C beta-lactamase-related serine hydrolase [Brevibacillus fluminis]|uniref:Class C beta-lactamase-related serine hydrolase n=1 Tax=Brevibacillus fluminis TaxID=511487 RepID=A0A3M8DA81_9BACL|nr:serine hydrolase [Brevibacillus fluminis]RNB85050.1 class C beta-lactamase-related serine hydrolase [Brevibacillus fluminis]
MNFESFTKEIKKEKINSVLITKNSENVYAYYKNKKQTDKLHKINSCTKSILSILVGIAIEKQYLKSLGTPVHEFFPKIFQAQTDSRKMSLTIRHLITMTDGLDFPEFGDWNCFAPMVYHHDIVKFVIDRPLLHDIGTHMNYNSGCSHILSAIIQQVTGMKTEDFANENLFKPLGIKEYRWYTDKMNISKGADGLVLKATDMEKIGTLMLQGGVFHDQRIISAEWIQASTTPNRLTYKNIGFYGMHWWVSKLDLDKDFTNENSFYFALGFGGQYIIVIPSDKLVITINSDIYEDSLLPLRLVRANLDQFTGQRVTHI